MALTVTSATESPPPVWMASRSIPFGVFASIFSHLKCHEKLDAMRACRSWHHAILAAVRNEEIGCIRRATSLFFSNGTEPQEIEEVIAKVQKAKNLHELKQTLHRARQILYPYVRKMSSSTDLTFQRNALFFQTTFVLAELSDGRERAKKLYALGDHITVIVEIQAQRAEKKLDSTLKTSWQPHEEQSMLESAGREIAFKDELSLFQKWHQDPHTVKGVTTAWAHMGAVDKVRAIMYANPNWTSFEKCFVRALIDCGRITEAWSFVQDKKPSDLEIYLLSIAKSFLTEKKSDLEKALMIAEKIVSSGGLSHSTFKLFVQIIECNKTIKNYPTAIAVLERLRLRTPEDALRLTMMHQEIQMDLLYVEAESYLAKKERRKALDTIGKMSEKLQSMGMIYFISDKKCTQLDARIAEIRKRIQQL